MPLAGTPMTEGMHPYEVLEHAALDRMSNQCFKVVTVQANAANPVLKPGAVLGEITGDNWTIHDSAALDGSQTLAFGSAGILMEATGPGGPNVTSTTGEPAVVLFQHGVVNGHMLQFADGMDGTEQAAALATLRDTADIQIDARF